jgi:hypothetical protein
MNLTEHDAEQVTKAEAYNEVVFESNDLVVLKMSGSQDGDSIDEYFKRTFKVFKDLPYKPNMLVDVSNVGFPQKSGIEAVRRWESKVAQYENKKAIYGFSEPVRLVTGMFLDKVLNNNQTKIFKTEAEAREWLEQNPPDKHATFEIPESILE